MPKTGGLSLTMVGCGNMGSSLLTRWLEDPTLLSSVHIITPHQTSAAPFLKDPRVQWHAEPTPDAFATQGLVLFAVKPQTLRLIAPLYRPFVAPSALLLSIAAGLEMPFYETHFPQKPCIRIMPNTPAQIAEGVSALFANALATEHHRLMADSLFRQVGPVFWVSSDLQIDQVTALSGCGPAYFYLMTEVLETIARTLGFAPEQARLLSTQTLIGSALYLRQTGSSATELRQRVTSPGGMTEAAIAELRNKGSFDILMEEAIHQALKRAIELRQ